MQKIESDIKKRWLWLAFINTLILIAFFGALMIGFGFFVVHSEQDALEKSITNYSAKLYSVDIEELKDVCTSDEWNSSIDNPQLSFAVYTLRGDGSYGFVSKNDFITANSPQIGGKTGSITEESIGEYKYLTYTVAASGGNGNYIKVFAPNDISASAVNNIKIYSIPFIIGFIILGIIFGLCWGYIEIKPVMTNYYKQKAFINDMSHEIRTPLAIIKGNLENVIATPEANVNAVSDSLETCLKEVDYMTDMSSGLLNIVRGENKSSKKDALFSDAVSDVVDLYSDAISMSNKALVACVDHCELQVDREKIKQLVTILIENSIKYTRESDRINVRLKNVTDGCVLMVSDTGIGVPKNELDSIFDRFYRAENAKDISGTGLGLSIAKTIVDSMGGTIKAVQNIPNGLEIIVQFKNIK